MSWGSKWGGVGSDRLAQTNVRHNHCLKWAPLTIGQYVAGIDSSEGSVIVFVVICRLICLTITLNAMTRNESIDPIDYNPIDLLSDVLVNSLVIRSAMTTTNTHLWHLLPQEDNDLIGAMLRSSTRAPAVRHDSKRLFRYCPIRTRPDHWLSTTLLTAYNWMIIIVPKLTNYQLTFLRAKKCSPIYAEIYFHFISL